MGFYFNIYTMAEARDFKVGTQFVFAKVHHNTTLRKKKGVALSYGNSHSLYLGFAFNISAAAVLSS